MINPAYTNSSTLKEMNSAYEMQGGIIVLGDFLDKKGNDAMLKMLNGRGKKLFRGDLFSYDNIDGETFLSSREFEEFCSIVSGKRRSLHERSNRKFSHRDFTLIHDEAKQSKRLVAIYVACKKWDENWGGASVFTKGDGSPFVFPVANNSLVLIECGKDDYEFTKYVNNHAKKNSFIQIKSVFD